MPVTRTYPGVYIEEVPSGVHPITGVATSIGAFVDFFPQGLLDEAVHIFSWADFERRFGGLDQRSNASYAVQQFFLNGGSDAYVVRTTSSTPANAAKAAAIILQDGSGNNILLATAGSPGASGKTVASPGQWGNALRLDVDYATTDPTSLFNLTVSEVDLSSPKPQPLVTENFRNLSLDSTQANYAENVVNNGSQLIVLQVLPVPSNAARPAQTGTVSNNFIGLGVSAPAWQAKKDYAKDTVILDANGNLQTVVVAGKSGDTPPAWSTNIGGQTTDGAASGGVTWQLTGKGAGIPAWSPSTAFPVGARIRDSNGNLQVVTTAGTSSSSAPTWQKQVGATTHDPDPPVASGVTWQLAPTGLGLTRPSWGPGKTYPPGAEIVDINGNLQRATQAGKSGSVPPNWKTSIGDQTLNDGAVNWTLVTGNQLALKLTDSMQVALNTNPAFANPIQLNVQTASIPLSWGSLVAALQTAIQNVDQKLKNATVAVIGSTSTEVFLQIKAGTAFPANYLVFSNGSGTLASTLGLDNAAAANVQQYALGSGQVRAQFPPGGNAQPGVDGVWDPGNDAAGMTAGLIGDELAKSGMYALLDVDLFNILCLPATALLPDSNAADVAASATALCERRRAFYILDPPQHDANRDTIAGIQTWLDQNSTLRSKDAALYFPRLDIADPLNNYQRQPFPPSGTIAGIYARTDGARGVWKAPAGTEATLAGVQALEYNLVDGENGVLNLLAINCLRNFPVYGSICWGARTLNGAEQIEDEYKYIPVRRLALFLEESLYRGLKWVVFEPNDEPLWAQIRMNVTAFMQTLFRQGAFQGSTPQKAYFVKCDDETTTPTDQLNGVVNIVVGFAPLKPAEFVIIKIQQIAGQSAS